MKDVGVNFWIVGHTKRKSNTDVVTGEEYETLTSNLMAKYFNAIKTKLHILGVASIDRSIEQQRIKQKIGGDKIVGKVKGESRLITFRDDNFNIDSKSRFAEITPQIELNSEQFIDAITGAIKSAHDKQVGVKSIEETKVEQEAEKLEVINEKLVEIKSVNPDKNKKLADIIKEKFPKAEANIKAQVKELLISNDIKLGSPEDAKTEVLESIVELLK